MTFIMMFLNSLLAVFVFLTGLQLVHSMPHDTVNTAAPSTDNHDSLSLPDIPFENSMIDTPSSADLNPLVSRQAAPAAVTATCFKNYVPTLARADPLATILICCPFIFPQGGWLPKGNGKPICCPNGISKEQCSTGDFLHVDPDGPKQCFGPRNFPRGLGDEIVVCMSPGSGLKRSEAGHEDGIEVGEGEHTKPSEEISVLDEKYKHNILTDFIEHDHDMIERLETLPHQHLHLPRNTISVLPPAVTTKSRAQSQNPITCPKDSIPAPALKAPFAYISICCPTNFEYAWQPIGGFDAPICCSNGTDMDACANDASKTMSPVEPESCEGQEGKMRDWNGVKVCEWIPEKNGAASVAGGELWKGLGILMLVAAAVGF